MGYLIRTRDEFYLDGTPALSVGLAAEIPPVPPMAQQRYTTWQAGGDTPISVPDNEYDPIKYPITARVIKNPDDFDNTEIYRFLQNKKILQISRLPDKHFKILRILGVTPKQNYRANEITYQITFMLEPWKYHDENPEIIVPAGGVIVNPGTRYSKPIFRAALSENSTLTCNGVALAINDTGAITVDSERMLIYKTVNGVNTAITQKTVGMLPMLSPGQNLIQWTGGISNLSCIGNWRDY